MNLKILWYNDLTSCLRARAWPNLEGINSEQKLSDLELKSSCFVRCQATQSLGLKVDKNSGVFILGLSEWKHKCGKWSHEFGIYVSILQIMVPRLFSEVALVWKNQTSREPFHINWLLIFRCKLCRINVQSLCTCVLFRALCTGSLRRSPVLVSLRY